MSSKLAMLALIPLALVSLTGCSASSEESSAEQSALETENNDRVRTLNGEFSRIECTYAATHGAPECSEGTPAGVGSITVELPARAPRLDRNPEVDQDFTMQMRVTSVKAPGILPGEAGVDASFDAELRQNLWTSVYDRQYKLLSRRYEGNAPRTIFQGDATGRSLGVGVEVTPEGKFGQVHMSLSLSVGLDKATHLIFKPTP